MEELMLMLAAMFPDHEPKQFQKLLGTTENILLNVTLTSKYTQKSTI